MPKSDDHKKEIRSFMSRFGRVSRQMLPSHWPVIREISIAYAIFMSTQICFLQDIYII